jgi:aquaporin Z
MAHCTLSKRMMAETVGTFWLVFAGCGSAVISAGYPALGIGFLGVGLAFGLTVLTMAYAVGHISGCHLNPAVSIGLCAGKRFPAKDLLPYIIAQLVGGIAGGGLLYVIASGKPGFISLAGVCNGYGEHSPGLYPMGSGMITEIVLTFMFLMIIMGSTARRAPQGFAPVAIGLGLTLIHLVGIPVTNLSVNPVRSTATAIFAGGGWPLTQLWLFWVAPIVGGLLGGIIYSVLEGGETEAPDSPLEKLSQQAEAAAQRAERTVPPASR